MKKMNKRGQERFLFEDIIPLIVGFLVLAMLIGFTAKACSKVYDLRKCHDALYLQAKVAEKFPAAEETKPWPVFCQTQGPIEITDKDKYKAMRKIADYMVNCYWALGESGNGGFDPFSKNWVIPWGKKC
ncbi:MAG: hypothetical protein N3D84_01230, partial [Candidatus Woesearchaeota archaeon]|nr:hypothetical protein [Candidatus Woesearchaeota archaeon]